MVPTGNNAKLLWLVNNTIKTIHHHLHHHHQFLLLQKYLTTAIYKAITNARTLYLFKSSFSTNTLIPLYQYFSIFHIFVLQ